MKYGGYGSRRAPWYIGFGLGTGNGDVTDCYGTKARPGGADTVHCDSP
jgi:hypothetical protein